MSRNRNKERFGNGRQSASDNQIVYMKSGDKPIQLNLKSATRYERTQTFKQSLLALSGTWHFIEVKHFTRYRKDEILDAIFRVIADNEFYPVGYTEGNNFDSFLVRQCKDAMLQLFYNALTVRMPDQQCIYLIVYVNAAEYKTGQIFPKKVLERIVDKQFRRLETTDKISQVLNLENLRSHQEMADIVINFANRAALEQICKVIAQNHHILNSINGLNLSKNNIVDLSPLKELVPSSIKMIDLRHNDIVQPHSFQHLKFLNLNELYVMGNPCAANMNYLDEIKMLLPTLKSLDGIGTDKIKQSAGDSIEMMYPGDLIQDGRDAAYFPQYKNSDKWCQVIIEHRGQCSKREILAALFEIFPKDASEFYPCYYKVARIEDTFFVRNSFEHLESLFDVGLSLRIPNCEEVPITLKMNVSDFKKGHVEPSVSIAAAIAARFNAANKCLNLEGFHRSPELKNVAVFMSNPRVLVSVLTNAVRRYLLNLEEILLGKNRISSVIALRTLNNAKSIKIMDLRDNLIESLNEFANEIKIPITHLVLDGNPLCKHFSVSSDYVRKVKRHFPALIELDGFDVSKLSSAFPVQRNYLCSLEAYGFVDQFVTSYFPIFDSPMRPQLAEMYSRNAMVSLTFNYDASKLNSYVLKRIHKYKSADRNILLNPHAPFFYRKNSIKEFLSGFPETEHVMGSFAIDVTAFSEQYICMTISGIYREPGNATEIELSFHFSRTFVFTQYASEIGIFKNTSEYKIGNELIHVTNLTNDETKKSYAYSSFNQSGPGPISVEDKENFIVMFQRMTGLKTIWCTKCFEEANWDFKSAMEIFVKMEKENRIPDTAFSNQREA